MNESQSRNSAEGLTEIERFMEWADPKGFTLDHLFMASAGVPENPFEDRDTKLAFDIWLARAAVSEQQPRAWIVTNDVGEFSLTFMDASAPAFWKDGKVADGYSITPLYERPDHG